MAKKKTEKVVNRLVIIGMGLIGSSLAAAVRERNIAKEVIGTDANKLRHDEIVAGCDGLNDESVSTVIKLKHPTVIPLPRVICIGIR